MTSTLPGGPRMTRRQALTTAGLTTAALLTGPITATQTHAAEPPDTALHTLPRRFGTPTDLAARNPLQAWTREPDGRIMTFDKATHHWTPAEQQDWPTITTYGQPVLLKWGRVSGTQLVVVFGTPPVKPPPAPTTPPTTASPAIPSQTAPTTPAAGRPQLSATGIDLAPLGVTGTLLVGAGAALLALRRRRGQTSDTAQH